ncbi:GTPase ObgE [Elusimicrobiota bacterium]
MLFIDAVRITVKSGGGGDGCSSFRREKFIPFGGPNGGSGGNGGSVCLKATENRNTLFQVSMSPIFIAERGTHGKGSNMTGACGKDKIIEVPLGTVAWEEAISSKGKGTQAHLRKCHPGRKSANDSERVFIGELTKHGQILTIAKGGKGGRGNTMFKTSTNRAPRNKETGFPGEDKFVFLELKLLADCGLLGFPNAGKSTLLKKLTRANPKVAPYPFTTIHPVLGKCVWKGKDFIIADMPGLIEGAHAGKGLGDEFLRHLERTKIFIHLVDPEGYAGIKPEKTISIINREVRSWKKEMAKRPKILIVTKMDLGEPSLKVYKRLRKKYPNVIAASAATGEGIPAILNKARKYL